METQRKTDFPVFAVDSEDDPGIIAAPRRLRFDQAPGPGGPAGRRAQGAGRRAQGAGAGQGPDRAGTVRQPNG